MNDQKVSDLPILEKIKEKVSPEELAELDALLNKQVVALGTDRCFALRDEKGEIRAYKQRVRLSETDGTLLKIKGNWSVTAQGYEVLADAAGACVMLPETVFVEGARHSNPWVFRDQNYRIVTVYARAIAFRFSAKGLPMVSDWVTTYDSPNYRLIDLLAKARDNKSLFKLLPNDMSPEIEYDANGKPVPRAWAKYYFDPACNLWVDTLSVESLDWHSNIINREKKALDYAQTFAKRNAVKHLLGIQKAPEGCKGVWDVTILCWRPVAGSIVKWDMTRYAEVRDVVDHLSSGGSFEIRNVDRGVEDATPEVDTVVEENGEHEIGSFAEYIEVKPEGEDKEPPPEAPKPEPPPAPRETRSRKKKPEAPKDERSERHIILEGSLKQMKAAYPQEFAAALEALDKAMGNAKNIPLNDMGELMLEKLNDLFSRQIDDTIAKEGRGK